MLQSLSQMKEVVLCSPEKINQAFVADFTLLFRQFEGNFCIDSVERRMLLLMLEKVLQAQWNQRNYRPAPASQQVVSISKIVFPAVGKMQFCKGSAFLCLIC
jgi:hypothetical protein